MSEEKKLNPLILEKDVNPEAAPIVPPSPEPSPAPTSETVE